MCGINDILIKGTTKPSCFIYSIHCRIPSRFSLLLLLVKISRSNVQKSTRLTSFRSKCSVVVKWETSELVSTYPKLDKEAFEIVVKLNDEIKTVEIFAISYFGCEYFFFSLFSFLIF